MSVNTLDDSSKFQEILPPPIIFETAGSQHRGIKVKEEKSEVTQNSHCPHCGFLIKSR